VYLSFAVTEYDENKTCITFIFNHCLPILKSPVSFFPTCGFRIWLICWPIFGYSEVSAKIILDLLLQLAYTFVHLKSVSLSAFCEQEKSISFCRISNGLFLAVRKE
jgi:hypothetical protein